MSKPRQRDSGRPGNVFQFTLIGLILFSLALMTASFIGFKLVGEHSLRQKFQDIFKADAPDLAEKVRVGPWVELVVRDIKLERPVEYLTDEVSNLQPETWTFNGMNAGAVKELLARDGLTARQVAAAFAPGNVSTNNSGTQLKLPVPFIFSLDANTRRQLCLGLAGRGVNTYLDFPFIFPGDSIDSVYENERVHPDDAALLKQLVYTNDNAVQMSDYHALLEKIPTVERRVALTQALTRQNAAFAWLKIRSDTDVDKIAAYWGHLPGIRFTDIRPLMDALKALPQGGDLRMFFLLPKFARDRLYTYPLPNRPGDSVMDCHWSTFNFFSETPDNRFSDPAYVGKFVDDNYYRISAPSLYGDIFLLMNDKNQLKHSAVYLADDLLFTKNGDNFRQPWMLMHIPDLLATYPSTPKLKVVYMRRKTD